MVNFIVYGEVLPKIKKEFNGKVIDLECGVLECWKRIARMKFSLENGKLEFNLENEWLENRCYKMDILLGTKKDAILRIMTVL